MIENRKPMTIPTHQDILGRLQGASTATQEAPKKATSTKEVSFKYGGEYNMGSDPNDIVRSPRDYGGYATKKGFQRDHIFPVALGGTSRANNIHYLEMTRALYKDRVNAYVLGEVKKGRMKLGTARNMVLSWRNVDIPGQKAYDKTWGEEQNVPSLFLKELLPIYGDKKPAHELTADIYD